MYKLILLLVVAVVAVWFFSSRRRVRPPDSAAPKPPAEARPPGVAAMVACAHCGLHLPQPETLPDGVGRAYCSEAHRQAGPR
jgi:uncharacterized protein